MEGAPADTFTLVRLFWYCPCTASDSSSWFGLTVSECWDHCQEEGLTSLNCFKTLFKEQTLSCQWSWALNWATNPTLTLHSRTVWPGLIAVTPAMSGNKLMSACEAPSCSSCLELTHCFCLNHYELKLFITFCGVFHGFGFYLHGLNSGKKNMSAWRLLWKLQLSSFFFYLWINFSFECLLACFLCALTGFCFPLCCSLWWCHDDVTVVIIVIHLKAVLNVKSLQKCPVLTSAMTFWTTLPNICRLVIKVNQSFPDLDEVIMGPTSHVPT